MTEATLPKTGLKLWVAPGACSLAAHALLREIGASFSLVELSFSKGFGEEFRRINPKMRVPALLVRSGEEVVTELPAIVAAISLMAPDQHLLGRTPMESVRAFEWMNWLSGTLHTQSYSAVLRPERFSDDEAMWGAISAKAMANVKACLAAIEGRLRGTHAVGEAFSAVDVYLFVFYRWGAGMGMDMRGEYPKYTALAEAVAQRPAVRAAVEAEKIKLFGFKDEVPLGASL